MKINNTLKAGLFYGGVAALIVLAGEVIDYIVDAKITKKEAEKTAEPETEIETEIVEAVEDAEAVEEPSVDAVAVETGKFIKGVAKVALASAVVGIACVVSSERAFKSGVIGGAYYFTKIGVTNEQTGEMISDRTKFNEILHVLRKAR